MSKVTADEAVDAETKEQRLEGTCLQDEAGALAPLHVGRESAGVETVRHVERPQHLIPGAVDVVQAQLTQDLSGGVWRGGAVVRAERRAAAVRLLRQHVD